MAFLGFCMFYITQVNLNIAVVAMSKTTGKLLDRVQESLKLPHNEKATFHSGLNDNETGTDCPAELQQNGVTRVHFHFVIY